MRLESRRLAAFWHSASLPRPLVIIGAGRWGRTLLDVAARARGGVAQLAVLARSNYDATCEWRASSPHLSNLVVARDLAAALEQLPAEHRRPLAIVATRPRDHYFDASRCLALKLDTLVEKPLVSNPFDAESLVQLAAKEGCALALGVEFSLMPVFHYTAGEFHAPVTDVHIDWQDPAGDARYGQVKRVHEEVHVLDDNLAHAVSIFRIFAPRGTGMSVTSARMDPGGHRGEVILATDGARLSFSADRAASGRVRVLRATSADGRQAIVDFATPSSALSIDGEKRTIPVEWSGMDSTLRLEIGAFLAHAADHAVVTPLTHDLREYARLQAAVRDALPT